MGADKAKLTVDGVAIGHRVVQEMFRSCQTVTVLGGDPIPPAHYVPDALPHSGPIAALSGFSLRAGYLFVASCDLPRFTKEVIEALFAEIGDHQAAIPLLHDRAQPLCALYRADALECLREVSRQGEARIMRWIDRLDTVLLNADRASWGRQVTNVNTPEELDAALNDQPPI